MGITAKSKNNENWGMGFLFVFFPQEDNDNSNDNHPSTPTTADKSSAHSLLSSSSPSSFSTPNASSSSSSSKSIKRTNSINSTPILSKAQSTLSICFFLLFLTLLLFTLSTFEPSSSSPPPRRLLSQKLWTTTTSHPRKNDMSFALQGMGRLFFRGTRSMTDLVVAHLPDDIDEADFRLFLRTLHRSGLTAKADTVLIVSSFSSRFDSLIQEECDSFLKLVQFYRGNERSHDSVSAPGFNVTPFVKGGKEDMGEPLWGKRMRISNNNYNNESREIEQGELTRLSYGSVVGFEASELDPENSLAGFLEYVPMSLRRWACYPMLIGRVRRNFKHIMLVDAKNFVLLSDPLGRIRSQSPESVYLATKQEIVSSSKHTKRNSEKIHSHSQVNSAILMGGTRGIRRFSSAMLTEIVRVAIQHKKKNLVTESGIFSRLVGNEHILKNVNLITSTELITDLSSLAGLNLNSNSPTWSSWSIIHRGNPNHELNSIIMKHICSCELESYVYRDC